MISNLVLRECESKLFSIYRRIAICVNNCSILISDVAQDMQYESNINFETSMSVFSITEYNLNSNYV